MLSAQPGLPNPPKRGEVMGRGCRCGSGVCWWQILASTDPGSWDTVMPQLSEQSWLETQKCRAAERSLLWPSVVKPPLHTASAAHSPRTHPLGAAQSSPPPPAPSAAPQTRGCSPAALCAGAVLSWAFTHAGMFDFASTTPSLCHPTQPLFPSSFRCC